MSELLACPICGCEANTCIRSHAWQDGGEGFRIECVGKCGLRTCWWHTKSQAEEAWNIRLAAKEAPAGERQRDMQIRLDEARWWVGQTGRLVTTALQLRIMNERVEMLERNALAAQPPAPRYCPKCGAETSTSGGHGEWCKNVFCKWGWETEMDGSPLEPPAPSGAAPATVCTNCGKTAEEHSTFWDGMNNVPYCKTAAPAVSREAQALSARITQYLSVGGLFNPELMEHDKVRQLLMDCREYFDASPAPQPSESKS